MGSSKASVRRTLKSAACEGLSVPVDRERRAGIVEVRPTGRRKEFAGRDDQGFSISVRMPEQSVNRVDLLFNEEEFPGSVSVYLDPDKQGDAFAWRASFEVREDGAVVFHPSLNGGDLEDYLARRLHECGLLALRKEGRAIVGAPLFCDGKRDDRDKLRTFLRETLTFILVKAEIERRLVYAPGTEPPPLDLPASSAAAKSRSRPKKKPKPPQPAGAVGAGAPARASAPAPASGKFPAPLLKGKAVVSAAPARASAPAPASGKVPAPLLKGKAVVAAAPARASVLAPASGKVPAPLPKGKAVVAAAPVPPRKATVAAGRGGAVPRKEPEKSKKLTEPHPRKPATRGGSRKGPRAPVRSARRGSSKGARARASGRKHSRRRAAPRRGRRR